MAATGTYSRLEEDRQVAFNEWICDTGVLYSPVLGNVLTGISGFATQSAR
jgi:hypothetical protein